MKKRRTGGEDGEEKVKDKKERKSRKRGRHRRTRRRSGYREGWRESGRRGEEKVEESKRAKGRKRGVLEKEDVKRSWAGLVKIKIINGERFPPTQSTDWLSPTDEVGLNLICSSSPWWMGGAPAGSSPWLPLCSGSSPPAAGNERQSSVGGGTAGRTRTLPGNRKREWAGQEACQPLTCRGSKIECGKRRKRIGNGTRRQEVRGQPTQTDTARGPCEEEEH